MLSQTATLTDWLDHEYLLTHDLRESTVVWYHSNLRAADRYAGHSLTLANVSDRAVNTLLANMVAAGRAVEYCRGVKVAVGAVWRDAAASGVCRPPSRLRAFRADERPVRYWTPGQVAALVRAAEALPGCFRDLGYPRGPYFGSAIRAAWDSALRRRDLHRLRRSDVGPDFLWRQHKTRKLVRVRLRPSTLQAIDRLGRFPDAFLWPLWGTDSAFGHTFDRMVAAAGLPRGPWRTIRRSAGMAAEARQPGAGHLLLGNTRRVFERHYLADGAVAGPQPPELEN